LKTLVLGLGNNLLGDDGAGIHALKKLEGIWPADDPSVEFVDGGTLSFTLAGLIQEADQLIVIDAAQLNATPGHVQVFENQDMDRFINGGRCTSVHEVSLSELMDIALLTGALPGRRALVGIQPQHLDWADQPTARVQAGIADACERTKQLLEAWRG
jgi:hydrogenase maturation protease